MTGPGQSLSAPRINHSQVVAPWAITCEWLCIAGGAASLLLFSMGLYNKKQIYRIIAAKIYFYFNWQFS